MNEQRAFVKNAADPAQVADGKKKESLSRRDELDDIRFILSTKNGRRVLWRLLTHCNVFGSVWHPSALIHHNSGRQDVGHFIMAEITEASPDAFLTMMKENKEGEMK